MKRATISLLPLFLFLGGCPSPQPAQPSSSPHEEVLIDPNCQVNVAAGGPFPNPYPGMNNAQHADATNVIAQLTFGDLYRNPPFRIQGPANLVRLDVQGVIPGNGRNWQVQVNGVNGASTLSTMLIDGTLAGASTADRQVYVARSARNGLVQSLNSGNTYRVTGDCN
jgi:hypothetical protein